MTKAAASLAVTLLALDALSQPCSAEAQPFAYPPKRVAWIVGQGLFNYNGDPWPGPPVEEIGHRLVETLRPKVAATLHESLLKSRRQILHRKIAERDWRTRSRPNSGRLRRFAYRRLRFRASCNVGRAPITRREFRAQIN